MVTIVEAVPAGPQSPMANRVTALRAAHRSAVVVLAGASSGAISEADVEARDAHARRTARVAPALKRPAEKRPDLGDRHVCASGVACPDNNARVEHHSPTRMTPRYCTIFFLHGMWMITRYFARLVDVCNFRKLI